MIPGHEATPAEETNSARKWQKLALAAGWQCKIGYSRFIDEDRTYASGAKQGETVIALPVENVWCEGYLKGNRFTIVWHDNKLSHCIYNRNLIKSTLLKEKINAGSDQEAQPLHQPPLWD